MFTQSKYLINIEWINGNYYLIGEASISKEEEK